MLLEDGDKTRIFNCVCSDDAPVHGVTGPAYWEWVRSATSPEHCGDEDKHRGGGFLGDSLR